MSPLTRLCPRPSRRGRAVGLPSGDAGTFEFADDSRHSSRGRKGMPFRPGIAKDACATSGEVPGPPEMVEQVRGKT